MGLGKQKLILFIIQILFSSMIFGQFLENVGPEEDVNTELSEEERSFQKEVDEANIVRGIMAVKISGAGNSVKISWIPCGQAGEYIIGRSSVPISNLQIMLSSESVGVIPSSESFIVDKGLKPGTYFYSVALRSLIKDRTAVLVRNENYTSAPVIFVTKEIETIGDTPPPVTLIFASQIKKNIIQVTWRGSRTTKVIYTVYRNNEPIKSEEILKRSNKVSEIKNGAEYYVDKDIVKPGNYYYAVTTRYENGKEGITLTAEQSYTRDGVEIEGSAGDRITQRIGARLVSSRAALIRWIDAPHNSIKGYRLYRSSKMINSASVLNSAELVAEIKKGKTKYTDKKLKKGYYYYALISVYKSGETDNIFLRGKNYIPSPIVVGSEKMGPVSLNSFSAIKNDKDTILIQWEYNPGDSENVYFWLYRNEEKIESKAKIEDSELIAKISDSETSYSDTDLSKGEYFYGGILYQNGEALSIDFEEGVNYTGAGIYIEGEPESIGDVVDEEPEESSNYTLNSVRRILFRTFNKGDYEQAIIELNSLLESGKLQNRAKGMAVLYIGISQYMLGNPKEAVRELLKPVVKDYYFKRARFWYRKSLEKIGP
jgi:hypothetical protein